jgi:chromosome segregation ATPase
MMAPLPNPTPPPDRPELPRVRLEVRTGSGRTVSYEVGGEEFLIGGAAGCDLRLPAPNLPPVVCQITRKPDGVKLRRLAPGLPVLLNGSPLPGNTAAAVTNADHLTVAGVEIGIAVQHTAVVRPRLVPFDEPAAAPPPAPDPSAVEARQRLLADEEAARRAEWARHDAELVRRQRDLDRQTEELEADRVLWYGRRQEMEREAAEFLANGPPSMAAREQEFNRTRDELSALREQLTRQFQDRRDQLVRTQDMVLETNTRLQEERAAFEVEVADRRQRAEAAAAEKLRAADEEIARRRAEAQAELAEYEPKLADLRGRQARLDAGFQELARQRDTFAADQEILAAARETFAAERAAETERLGTWEQVLTGRETDLVRRDEELRTDRAAFDRDRAQLNDDLLRLDRRRAEADERDQALDARAREADVRLEQLKRDAAEWEETLLLATAEQERLRAEADRLDRERTELDSQSAKLTERAAQLEAQQGVLAVLRVKLDRTREEVEREASALVAARVREEESQAELRARIHEAEHLRAELGAVQENAALEQRRLAEHDSLLAAGLEEIRQQKEALAADEERVRQREAELDARSSEFAEQAGSLKGRMAQAFDLQARLEADRVAVREREAALAQAEEARQALQEQLRRRAEDLAARAKALDEVARQLAADRGTIDQARAAGEAHRTAAEERVAALRQEVEARAVGIERQVQETADREAALGRQVVRLKEVGQAVAAERKALADARAKWEADRSAAEADARAAREQLDAFRARAAADIAALRAQAPELEEQATAALDRLAAAKDTLRGHLAELSDFARQGRDDLDAVRAQVRAEADRLREQEATLDRARTEHRLAVTAFRQQVVDWQGKIAEMKRGLSTSETRLEAKQQAVDQATRQIDATSQQLAEETDRLRRERGEVVQRRTEVERHLADMREWYRRKLRELADSRAADRSPRGADPDEPPPFDKPRLAALPDADGAPESSDSAPRGPHPAFEDLDPGDRQLGELLRSLELVDAESLAALWGEATRQRRTLRQVLLASGAVTLYQLALIEAGNLDGLMLGRFRVIDRLRVTPREAMYRVLDPTRLDGKAGGVFLLRHLADAEAHDAVRPDEFRQRFGAARDAAHPNLSAVVEVLEVNGRPAVLQEWLAGLFSADWPAHAAHPGCWVRLVTMAAEGIDAAHRVGLAHGRLTADSFVLTAGGALKVTGFGDPPWLAAGPTPSADPTAAADLRALGQVAFGWAQLSAKKKGVRPAKPFPAELGAVVRRLEADADPPMADTVAADRPYASAAELVADLKRVARATTFSDDAWEKLLRHVADNAPDAPAALRQSA